MADDDLLTERLLRIIDEGSRITTYKLALLLALIDAVAMLPGEDSVPTRLIAERVLATYYPQTRGFIAERGAETDLQQISNKRAVVLEQTLKLRIHGEGAGCRTAEDCRRTIPSIYESVADVVEARFVADPIPRLQKVGGSVFPFLYEQAWEEDASLGALRRSGSAHLTLFPGVAARLVVLGPLLRPLIELHWTRDVAKWSRLDLQDEKLRSHLFGTERAAFPAQLRGGLRELQENRCFSCDQPIKGAAHVDHFVAWARWPNDAVENLVLADGSCNSRKSDHFAAESHLHRWAARNAAHGTDLASMAERSRWESSAARTAALARSAYGHIAPSTPLWVKGSTFTPAPGPIAVP
jgi:5-methylcytosine-specific restriction endonuclease McrA